MRTVRSKTYPVSEIYGPVCQGEGPLAGAPTIFVRLGGCDYRCTWCDSLYAVDPKYVKDWTRMTATEIADKIDKLSPKSVAFKHVTFSGGNPLIHDLTDLVNELWLNNTVMAVETQGTIYKSWLKKMNTIVVSPKPPSSGNVTMADDEGLTTILSPSGALYRNVAIKVVIDVERDDDIEYAKIIANTFPTFPMWLQAKTDVREDTRESLLDKLWMIQSIVLSTPELYNCRASIQQHVLIHGHKRGI